MSRPQDEEPLPNNVSAWKLRAKANGLKESEYLSCEIPQMNSASQVELADWLRLRILWKVHGRDHPSHERLFGTLGIERIANLRNTSQNLLRKMPWYRAVQNELDSPVEWQGLAAWKQSVRTIERRLELQTAIQKSVGVKSGAEELGGEDLFNAVKLWVEPRSLQFEHADVETALEDEGDKARKPRVRRNTRGEWESPATTNLPGTVKPEATATRDSSQGEGMERESYTSGSSFGTALIRPPDEEIINMSLILLLQGLCMYDASLCDKVGWYAIRMPFSVTKLKAKVMTARIDGCLQVLQNEKLEEECPTLAIVEVKPKKRADIRKSVQIQEGAEMAAWISSKPTSGVLPSLTESHLYRRVILSQDFDEIFVTIAEYDDQYVKYITGQNAVTYGSSNPQVVSSSSDDEKAEPQSAPRQGLPVRGKTTTPPGGSPKQGISPPGAPVKGKQPESSGGLEGNPNSGFLTMHEYKGFKVTNMAHMEQLMVLLISLTQELYGQYMKGK
ncbi:hypothetical protein PT974_04950 [Cladobotryum mycophilum]|uniref:Uncharacterized protein n=1 Tax=Cladobotryum mycophilum TaxID=491253 RepID=A0ABR0SRX5_9HYPO